MNTIIEHFQHSAALHPATVAVTHGDAALTYADLHKKSDQLAGILFRHGIKTDTPVAVVLGHGPAAAIAIWGVLKAGAAFVPIDPELPKDRIAFILEETGCTVLVTDEITSPQLPPGKFARIVLDTDWQRSVAEPDAMPHTLANAADLAYIMYTSGSTGQPKGVMIEHRQILAYLNNVRQRLDVDSCESYAILGTLAADAAYTAFFLAHCFGKSLHFFSIKGFTSFSALVNSFMEHAIDCYKITPSLLQILLQHKDGDKTLPRKRLILGGESCPADLARRVLPLLPTGCRFFNHYGPTETTIGVITYEFSLIAGSVPPSIPLGKPLPEVSLHILDDRGHEVTPGEKGELYVEGALVGRGYWNQPELTQQRFIRQHGRNESPWYRTGDVVSLMPDGNIEYHGRVDHQIKLNGNRIEPKEIENAILQSGLSSRCAVKLTQKDTGAGYLVAYITPAGNYTVTRLKDALRRKLPAYMIPSKYIELDTWPINFNNKTDYSALAEPPSASLRRIGKKIASRNPLKKSLMEIWRSLLAVDRITVKDNFFELGGTSLLLIRLAFELSARFRLELSPLELITRPILKEQYDYLSSKHDQQRHPNPSSPKPRVRLQEFDPEEASVAQRNFFIQNRMNPSLTFPYSSTTFRITGEIDPQRLESAFQELVAIHDSLRMSFVFKGGKVCKQIHADITVPLNYQCSQGTDIDQVISGLVQPFDLTHPPLVRVFLISLADSSRFLHIYMPHINSDGESLNIMMATFETFYNGARPEKEPLQFVEFQRKVHQYLGSPQFQEDQEFWQQRLTNDIDQSIPIKNNGTPGKHAGTGAVLHFSIAQRTAITAYSRANGLTSFQLLSAAWVLLLHNLTGSDRIMVMLPLHNRNDRGMDSVIGLLANVVLLDVSINTKDTLRNFLSYYRATMLSTLNHQRFAFERQLKLWPNQGKSLQKLLSFFFSYHYSRGEYRFGQATLDLHIPARDKENLPLSAALFETENRLILRLGATAGYYNRQELEQLGKNYMNILARLTATNGRESLSTLTNFNHDYGKEILV